MQGRWSIDRFVSNVRSTGVWVCLIWRAPDLLKDLHTWADPWWGTQCGDKRWVRLFLASSQTQKLKVDVSLWAKHCLSTSAERPFVTFLGPLTFHGFEKNYIRSEWWVLLRTLLASGAAGRWRRSALTRIGRQDRASWTTPRSCSPGNLFGMRYPFLTWTTRRAWLRSQQPLVRRNGWACLLLRVSLPVLGSHREWMACIKPKQRNKGLYDDANFSHCDLDLYFRHQLRVKIRCNRKCLDRITFSKRWKNAASLVVRKGAMLESSFPPLPAHGVYGMGPSGPHLG